MTLPNTDLPDSYFHEDSGSVRFWVRTPSGETVGATVRQQVLRYRYRLDIDGEAAALLAYRDHRGEIEAAALRRIASGSIEPVMLREADLALPVLR